ncbi:MAG TPA: hypothetical protein VN420_02305 [Candidatus Fimivivens sp.]|nr:hypothetical protein [Candidatus Fimivivens sp.]
MRELIRKSGSYLRRHHILAAFVAYAALALVFTYPLVFNLTSVIPKGGRDSFLVIATIERLSDIVREQGWRNGFITLAKTYQLNSYLPYVVIGQFTTAYGANNILFLGSFLFSAIGAYMLAYHLTKSGPGSFLAGLIFAFSPFHTYQSTAIHVGSMHQELLPFFALYLMRFFEGFRFRHFAIVSVLAALIALTEHQLLAFTVIFTAGFLAYAVVTNRRVIRDKRFWAYFSVSGALLFVFALVLFKPLLSVTFSGNNYLDPGIKSVRNLSAYAVDTVLPPQFHGIWPGLNEFLQENVFHTSHKGDSYYVGPTVFLLIGYVLFRLFGSRRLASDDGGMLRFWIIVTLGFLVLSFGPTMSLYRWTIPLPYFVIYKLVPFYSNIRTVGRFLVFAILGASVLSAYAVADIRRRNVSKNVARVAMVCACALVLVEYWIAPIRTTVFTHSPFYDRIAEDGGTYRLLEIPGSTNDVFFNYEWITRNVHHKELLNGMPMAREIDGQFDFQKNTPVVRELLYSIPKGSDPLGKSQNDILRGFEWVQAPDILNYAGVGFVTVSKEYTSAEVRDTVERFMRAYVPSAERIEDEFLIAYAIPRLDPMGIYAVFRIDGGGFSDVFPATDGSMRREIGDGARLNVVNMESVPKRVKIVVSAQSVSDIGFDVTTDGIAGTRRNQVSPDAGEYLFETTLLPGNNELVFHVTDRNGNPVAVREKKKDRFRALIVSAVSIVTE